MTSWFWILCGLLDFDEVVVVQVIGDRDGRLVPLLPLISPVAADQQNGR
jgi:hypothetical protein